MHGQQNIKKYRWQFSDQTLREKWIPSALSGWHLTSY